MTLVLPCGSKEERIQTSRDSGAGVGAVQCGCMGVLTVQRGQERRQTSIREVMGGVRIHL